MDKVTLLKEKTKIFKNLLLSNIDDREVRLWLMTLNPLFDEIEAGKIIPPKYFEHGLCLGKEHDFYMPNSIYSKSYSAFVCAMEDWMSDPFFAKAVAREAEGKPPFSEEK